MLSLDNKRLIENYYRHIRELYIQLDSIELHHASNEQARLEVIEELKEIHNKLSISHLMSDRDLLAITGLQGTGKTTIIKRLYDLPDDILPENSGRGERLPVFIKEKKVDEIETYVYRLQKNEEGELIIAPESVSPKAFNDISMNPVANRDIWLECVVPERYLKDGQKSIVLLPGFEKDQKDISQLLLEHILYLSNSSVMVLRKDTFARAETQRMMDRVKEIYKNTKPVVAITFGDVNPNENPSFKQQLLEEFGIPGHEQGRVIITGEKPEFNEEWEQHLMQAIDSYGFAEQTEGNLFNELILSMVKKTESLLFKIKKIIDNELKQRQLSKVQIEDRRTVLTYFENEYSKVLEDLEQQIKANLEQRIVPARTALRDYLDENTTWTKELKTKFFGQKPQELYVLESKIQEIWDKPNGNKIIIDANEDKLILPANVEVLTTVSNYLASFGKEVIENVDHGTKSTAFTSPKLEESQSEFLNAIQNTAPKKVTTPKNEPQLPLERIDHYFAAKNEIPLQLRRNDYKTLAVIGTMLIQETYAAETGYDKGDTGLAPELLGEASVDIDVLKNIESLSVAAPKVLKSIPIILGVDGVLDGELDLLTNASAALATIGIKVTAAQLIGIIGAGFAAAYAAKAIQESMRRANERQLQLAQAGERVFNELPGLQAKAFTNSLRRIFERMSRQLLDKHLELSGHYDSVGEVEQISYIVRKVGRLSKDIKREINEQTAFVGI